MKNQNQFTKSRKRTSCTAAILTEKERMNEWIKEKKDRKNNNLSQLNERHFNTGNIDVRF